MDSFMPDTPSSQIVKTYPLYASVALDDGLDQLLDYGIDATLIPSIEVGCRVEVPLRKAFREATVVEIKKNSTLSCHPIEKVLSKTLISKDLFKLAEWISQYYICPIRKVLHLLLPLSIRSPKKEPEVLFVKPLLSQEALAAFTSKIRGQKQSQAKVCDYLLKNRKTHLLSELIEEVKTSVSPIHSLVKEGIISLEKGVKETEFETERVLSKPKILSSEQQGVVEAIAAKIKKNEFSAHLLHGVTGSGKTEVYLELIEKVLSMGSGCLMMVPEVALTTQMIERFQARFQLPIGVYHYKMGGKEKRDLWRKVASGEILLVLGARSSIFLPFKNLKLIIVDEEHETSYKQEEKSPCYQARDVAIMRAHIEKSTVILGSATPSFESYSNALKGKYYLHELKQRALTKNFPIITLIDMKKEKEKNKKISLFSDPLLKKIKQKMEAKEQVLLFLNRRGFYSRLVCPSCEDVKKCPNCDLSLTYHLKDKSLLCHCCGYLLKHPPRRCESCKSDEPLVFRGYGTEQVEEKLKKIFPEIIVLRMDSDTTTKKGAHQKIYQNFKLEKADVLIGTQMIAKGFHFPAVTLVGILNPDSSLHHVDFRSSEHLFSLLMQASGRCGRDLLQGEVLIQTHIPSHPLFKHLTAQDYLGFYQEESASRAFFHYPPFTRLAKITFFSKQEALAKESIDRLHHHLQKNLPPSITLLPPIADPLSKAQNLYRFYFMIKSSSPSLLSSILTNSLKSIRFNKNVNYLINIDY